MRVLKNHFDKPATGSFTDWIRLLGMVIQNANNQPGFNIDKQIFFKNIFDTVNRIDFFPKLQNRFSNPYTP